MLPGNCWRHRALFWLLAYGGALLVSGAFWYTLGHPRHIAEPEVPEHHKLQCVSYAPFEKNQSPFDFDRGLKIAPERVAVDLALLARRFDCVRTYSTVGLEAVPLYAKKFGLRVLLGAWVNSDRIATRRELKLAIDLARQHPDVVRAIIVGNEALLRKEVTGEQLANYIREVKTALPETPVTYADVWEFWLKHPELAPATDFITIHILPYWEDRPADIDSAMAHIKETYAEVAERIPGKAILIGETGWPSRGRMRAGALPSKENQARFLRGFVQLAEQERWNYNLIEAFDQPWKRINEGAVGGFWGLYDTQRADKQVFSGPASNYPAWRQLFLLSAAISGLMPIVVRRHRPCSAVHAVALTSFAIIGAVLLPLQVDQFAFTARNGWEYFWAAILISLSAAAYFFCIQAIAAQRRIAPAPIAESLSFIAKPSGFQAMHGHGLLRLAILFCAMVEVTGLVFDSRYRSFNTFAFALPAFGYWLVTRGPVGTGGNRSAEKFAALFLIAGAVFILINETPRNMQAIAWSAICLVLAYPLWKEARGVRLTAIKTVLTAGIIGYAVAAGARYGVMESVDLVSVCADKTAGGLCSLRAGLGRVIHYQGFGWLSLASAALALATRRYAVAVATLILSIAGLTLYNASLSAFSFVVSLLVMAMSTQLRSAIDASELHTRGGRP